MTQQTAVDVAIDWLHSQTTERPTQGLERVVHALELLDNPHEGLPVIQVTGTNGKGSTTKMLEGLLMSQGYKVGSFTSPFILTFHERFQINQKNISDEDLINCVHQLQDLNQKMSQTSLGPLVFFELYTVLMVLYFVQKEVDIALVEVGIGGRRDSTNALTADLALVTTIGLDHEEHLGSTLRSVATEKFGIVKEGTALVAGRLPQETFEVRPSGESYYLGEDFEAQEIVLGHGGIYEFTYQEATLQLPKVSCGLIGRHQVDNACVALKAFHWWMNRAHLPIDWQRALDQLGRTQWMVRMEKVHARPDVYLDGGHNPQSLQALVASVKNLYHSPVTLLYAGLATKDVSGNLQILSQGLPDSTLLVTAFNFPQAWKPSPGEFPVVEDWQKFVQNHLKTQDTPLIVMGSLYFVGQVRQFLKKK